MIVVAELLIRLAPLLILIVVGWVVVKVVLAHRRRSADSARLQTQWLRTPAPAAVIPVAPVTPSLPPLIPHYERVYLVAGENGGFGADRSDGYLNVAAPALPPFRPAQASPPLPSLAARRATRRRPTRRSVRP